MRAAFRRQTSVESTGSVRRHFTSGKAKFGGMDVSGRPEAEGARGRKRQAEEVASRTDARQRNAQGCRLAKVVTPAAKRGAVAHLCKAHEVSQRRACSVLDVDRSSMRYRSVRADDGDLRKAMKEVADERRRFGYRRVHLMLERQGWLVNQKKLRRLYAEEKLQVKRRGGRKRALATRRPMRVPGRPNERWSLDFVSDAFTDGRRFRVLAIVDDFSRECLSLVALAIVLGPMADLMARPSFRASASHGNSRRSSPAEADPKPS